MASSEFTGSFGLLPEGDKRWGSIGISMAVNITIGALLFLVTMLHVGQRKFIQRYNSTELILPTTPPKEPPPAPSMPKFHLQPPPPMLMPVDQPRIILPKPLPPEPPKIEMKAETLTPKVLAPQQKVVLAPQPRLAMATNQQATVIKQSLLGKSAAFGDPFGARPIANAQRSATMTAFGGVGSGQQSNMVRSGVVQGTGFGTGSGAARGTSSNGVVASTAFSNSSANRPSAQQPTQQAVASINPVILSEPKAQYTEQAKSAHAHGEVIVAVLFRADGSVTVQHVVRGLGYGLDEEAMKVAAGIRFKPATRGGQPVDFETNIHVVFQLA